MDRGTRYLLAGALKGTHFNENASRMTRAANSIARLLLAAMTMAMIGGCASWRNKSDGVVRIELSQNPEKAAKLTNAGIHALTCGSIDVASEKFLAAVDADVTYGPAHNNLGLLHYEQGNLYQAVLAFEEAMELMPQDPTVLYNLALTLESAGKIHEALDLYLQAAEMDPVNPNFLGNLVRLRIRMGEDDPSLVAQLQDLILIETRPDWRSWADQQLALRFNPILDRGPETPEFNLNQDRDKAKQTDRNVDDQIIDLTNGEQADQRPDARPAPQTIPSPVDQPTQSSPVLTAPQSEPVAEPMPIYDDASIEVLPPSIEMNPDDLPVDMDYFR